MKFCIINAKYYKRLLDDNNIVSPFFMCLNLN